MSTARRRPIVLGSLLAAVVAVGLVSCGGEPTGAALAGGSGSIKFALLFQSTGTTSVIRDTVSQVRVIVTRVSPAPVAVISDQVQALGGNSNNSSTTGDSITATFPLQGADAQYQIVLKAFNTGSDTLYQIGPLGFTAAQANAIGGVHLDVPQSQILYIGPGSDAVKVVASPHSVNLLPGQTFQFSAQAFSSSGAAVPRALFKWSVVTGTSVANVDGNGQVFALNSRGSAVIAVGVPSTSAPSDTVIVNVSLGAAQLLLVSGGNQSGPGGSALANPVVVKVVASDGVPVPGVAVTFNTSGAASPATAMTDANGLAQTHWTLANTAGSQTLNVSAANVPTLAVQATATQAALTLVSGSGQSALTGHALAQPIVVQVANGTAGVSGVNVTFAVASGNGSVSPTTVATDATGRAQTTWTMGTAAGTETMTVTAAGAGGSLTVTANATVAPTISFVSVLPTAITTAGSSTIVALVTGTNGLPQSGALVTFTSSGTGNTISPATATTDVSGHATVLFSSTVAENKTITATANGVSAQVSLPVVAATTSAVTIVKVSGDGQTVHYGTSFGAPLVVRAMDANGSPVAGALIDWGTAAGNLRKVTDANGLSSNTYQLANDPIDFPAGIAAHITVTLVGTAAAVVFSYLPAP